jgi:hypothetical protein
MRAIETRSHKTEDTKMTIAAQIAALTSHIAECLEMIEASYLNFNLSESEVVEEVAYYQQQLATYRDRKAALEVWA